MGLPLAESREELPKPKRVLERRAQLKGRLRPRRVRPLHGLPVAGGMGSDAANSFWSADFYREIYAMADLASTIGTPRKILVATDLSARCDRALERAMSLAAGWEAQLTILHVIEETRDTPLTQAGYAQPSWRRPPDTLYIAKERIRLGLRADVEDAVEKVAILVDEGEPAEIIERVAVAEGFELVITGIAREVPFARFPVTLGKTVERLLRRLPVPILIVRNRARAPYGHILVATDFSEGSAHALQVALRFFACQKLHVLHAFKVPYAGFISDPAKYEQNLAQALVTDLEKFLTSLVLSEGERGRLEPLIEHGHPEELVRLYVQDRQGDLVVLGTQGRSALLEALIGSTAKNILSTVPCDALVVRAPRTLPPRES